MSTPFLSQLYAAVTTATCQETFSDWWFINMTKLGTKKSCNLMSRLAKLVRLARLVKLASSILGSCNDRSRYCHHRARTLSTGVVTIGRGCRLPPGAHKPRYSRCKNPSLNPSAAGDSKSVYKGDLGAYGMRMDYAHTVRAR